MIEVIINNNKYFFEKNITVLQACEQAQISIPRFCYHEKLSVAGNCRMCLVEIEKSPKPIASCAMPINPGMVIFTETPLVKKAREAVLEFLLINHPLDCPICDQGGECDLQDITLNYGSDRSRFFEFKRGVEDKECGPIVKTIMTRCIHCTRCIRFLTELAGIEVFGAIGRGEIMEIGTYLNKYLKTELSGNLVDLCPVGALTSKPYAFLARNWELKKFETVDFSDAIGSNIVVHTRNNSSASILKNTKNLENDQILRILPKLNNEINENWISDKTRYAFDGLNFNRNCFLEFFKKSQNTKVTESWNTKFLTNISNVSSVTIKNNNLIGILGSVSSVEELFFFSQFLKKNGNSNFLVEKNLYNLNKDLPNFYLFNSQLKNIETADLILIIGVNTRSESSMLNLKIRKHFFNKEVSVGYIGPNVDFTFPVTHLGNSTKKFLEIVEGKHKFCQQIRKAKKPLIIFGSEFGYRQDFGTLQNLTRFLAKKTFLNLKSFVGLNTIHQNLTQIVSCDLGLSINAKSSLNLLTIGKKKVCYKEKTFLFHNIDFQLPKAVDETFNTFLFNLNTHNQNLNNKSIFNIPTNTLFEKDNLLINTEGRIQKSFKVTTPKTLSRNSEDFLKILLKLNSNVNVINLTNKFLYLEAPFLKNLNKPRKSFYLNFLNLKENQKKLYFTSFKPINKNFYMSDNISKNSKVMAECALFLKNKTNFL